MILISSNRSPLSTLALHERQIGRSADFEAVRSVFEREVGKGPETIAVFLSVSELEVAETTFQGFYRERLLRCSDGNRKALARRGFCVVALYAAPKVANVSGSRGWTCAFAG